MVFFAIKPYYKQEHMTEGASNGGNHSSCKFAELFGKPLMGVAGNFIALTVHFQ